MKISLIEDERLRRLAQTWWAFSEDERNVIVGKVMYAAFLPGRVLRRRSK